MWITSENLDHLKESHSRVFRVLKVLSKDKLIDPNLTFVNLT